MNVLAPCRSRKRYHSAGIILLIAGLSFVLFLLQFFVFLLYNSFQRLRSWVRLAPMLPTAGAVTTLDGTPGGSKAQVACRMRQATDAASVPNRLTKAVYYISAYFKPRRSRKPYQGLRIQLPKEEAQGQRPSSVYAQ